MLPCVAQTLYSNVHHALANQQTPQAHHHRSLSFLLAYLSLPARRCSADGMLQQAAAVATHATRKVHDAHLQTPHAHSAATSFTTLPVISWQQAGDELAVISSLYPLLSCSLFLPCSPCQIKL